MRRKLLVVLALVALVVGLTGCLPTNDENVFLASINSTRAARGLPALKWDDGPTHDLAVNWSKHMAATGILAHPVDISAGMPAGWRYLGQNVGTGPDLPALAKAFIASPHHPANMVNPNFNRVAVGVFKSGAVYWVTEDFTG